MKCSSSLFCPVAVIICCALLMHLFSASLLVCFCHHLSCCAILWLLDSWIALVQWSRCFSPSIIGIYLAGFSAWYLSLWCSFTLISWCLITSSPGGFDGSRGFRRIWQCSLPFVFQHLVFLILSFGVIWRFTLYFKLMGNHLFVSFSSSVAWWMIYSLLLVGYHFAWKGIYRHTEGSLHFSHFIVLRIG